MDMKEEISAGLRRLTEKLSEANAEVSHGALGGDFGYGAIWNNDVFEMHPYCWCDEDTCPWCADEAAPNFWHKQSDVKIWWYKYIGRSMKVKIPKGVEWTKVLSECFDSVVAKIESKKIMPEMQRSFEPCSQEFLKGIIDKAILAHSDTQDKDEDDDEDFRSYDILTPEVQKDLQTVRFTAENSYVTPDAFENCGYRTLINGMQYLSIYSGGDWETKIYYILYWDGKTVRGYIPEDGNPWNRTNRKAYGNDQDLDLIDAKKNGFIHQDSTWVPELSANFEKIEAEIMNKIKPITA